MTVPFLFPDSTICRPVNPLTVDGKNNKLRLYPPSCGPLVSFIS